MQAAGGKAADRLIGAVVSQRRVAVGGDGGVGLGNGGAHAGGLGQGVVARQAGAIDQGVGGRCSAGPGVLVIKGAAGGGGDVVADSVHKPAERADRDGSCFVAVVGLACCGGAAHAQGFGRDGGGRPCLIAD